MWAVSPGGVFLWALTYFTKQRNPSSETGGRGNAASKELCAIHQGRLQFYRGGLLSSHALQHGFWSISVKEIKERFKSERENGHCITRHLVLKPEKDKCYGMQRLNGCAACCGTPWMKKGSLSWGWKSILQSLLELWSLCLPLWAECVVDQFSHWSSVPLCI